MQPFNAVRLGHLPVGHERLVGTALGVDLGTQDTGPWGERRAGLHAIAHPQRPLAFARGPAVALAAVVGGLAIELGA